MSVQPRETRWLSLAVEGSLVALVVGSVIWVAYSFSQTGYLPAPYLYNPVDTFMDWFNVAFWSHNWGAYEAWGAVYPPFSFVFMKIFGLPRCYLSSPFWARDCDWLGTVTLLAIYALDVVIAARIFWWKDKRTAVMRSVAFALGLPMLFALERGNLILLCLTFFMIAYSGFYTSKWWRWSSIAITINLKPYMILPALALCIRRDWRSFEIAGVLALLIYLLSWAIFQQGGPIEIMQNLRAWSTNYNDSVWQPMYYTTTYAGLMNIKVFYLPILRYLPSRDIEFILAAIPVAITMTQVITLLAIAGAWLHPYAVEEHRLPALLLGVGLVSQAWGGYTQIMLIFMVFLEPWKRPGPIIALLATYALSVSLDWQIAKFPSGGSWWEVSSWLGNRTIEHEYGLGWGQFARPALIIIIVWGLALDTLVQTFRANRREAPHVSIRPLSTTKSALA